ncbi:hypothetical protein Tco_0259635 [Tanacetum coccineum]
MTEEEIRNQKALEDQAKYEAVQTERNKAPSPITSCDILNSKGSINMKIYREDGTDETIDGFKFSDLHLNEWKEVMNTYEN